MNAKTHEITLITFTGMAILVMIALFSIGSSQENHNSDLSKLVLAWLIGFPTLDMGLIYLVPVYCDEPGCTGRMHKIWLKEARFQWRLYYRCDACDNSHASKFTFTFGGPNDW